MPLLFRAQVPNRALEDRHLWVNPILKRWTHVIYIYIYNICIELHIYVHIYVSRAQVPNRALEDRDLLLLLAELHRLCRVQQAKESQVCIYLSVDISIYIPIYVSVSMCVRVNPSVQQAKERQVRIYPSIYLFIDLGLTLTQRESGAYLSIYRYIYLCIYVCVYLATYLSSTASAERSRLKRIR